MNIRVNGITLSPRQPITHSPYSIQTRGIYVSDDQSFVGIGRTEPITAAETFGISTPWDGRTEDGVRVRSGVYFLRTSAGRWTSTPKMTVLE